MVHRICDDKEDLSEINLDEVVKEVYRQGGMKDFIENLSPRQGDPKYLDAVKQTR